MPIFDSRQGANHFKLNTMINQIFGRISFLLIFIAVFFSAAFHHITRGEFLICMSVLVSCEVLKTTIQKHND